MIREVADERRELLALRAAAGAKPTFPPRGGEGEARESQLKEAERSPAQEKEKTLREKSEEELKEAKNQAESASLPDPNRHF